MIYAGLTRVDLCTHVSVPARFPNELNLTANADTNPWLPKGTGMMVNVEDE